MDAALRQEAGRLFAEGTSMQMLSRIYDSKVSRKTLYNWRNEDKWDEIRKSQISKSASIKQGLEDLLENSMREAKANPSPSNIFAVVKMLSAYRTFTQIPKSLVDEGETETSKINPEELDAQISQILGF